MSAPLGGFVMRNALVSFAGTDYANQVSMAILEPDQDTKTYRTLVPDGVKQDVDSAAWTLKLKGLQDHTAAQGLARYMFDNDGTTVAAVLEPQAGGISWAVQVVLKATQIGGDQGDWAEIEIELPCEGAPVPTDPV